MSLASGAEPGPVLRRAVTGDLSRPRESVWDPPRGDAHMTRQGGAFRRPLYRHVERSRALRADTSLTQEPGAAMTPGGAGAALEPAAVKTAVAIDAVVAAEGGSADRRALRVGRARPAEGDIAATQAAANWLTDALGTIETATALGSSRAATTLEAAAVQGTIAGDPIVVAENSASRLAAFAGVGALPTKSDGPAITTRGSADSVRAEQTTAADVVSITPAAAVVTAVQDAVEVDSVRGADRGSRRLTALTGLRAFSAECQPTGSVVRADAIHAIEATAAPSAVVASRARTPFIAATVQRTIAVIPIVRADGSATSLAALGRRGALRPRSESSRCRRSRRGPAASAIHAEEIRATLNVVRARAASIAAAVAGAVGGNAVACANDRSAGLATFACRGALGAERPPACTYTTAARAALADRPAAAMEVRGARPPGIAATIELSIANNSVVAADDGTASLATFGVGAERGTLPAKWNRVLCTCCPRHADRKPRRGYGGGKSLEHAAPRRSRGDRPR
jgi:hypothetical protein